jgi:hypothetical protein
VLGALLTGGQHLLASHPPAVAAGPCTEKRTWSLKIIEPQKLLQTAEMGGTFLKGKIRLNPLLLYIWSQVCLALGQQVATWIRIC